MGIICHSSVYTACENRASVYKFVIIDAAFIIKDIYFFYLLETVDF